MITSMQARYMRRLLEFPFRSKQTEVEELGVRLAKVGLYLRARRASFTRFSRLSSFTLQKRDVPQLPQETRYYPWHTPEQHLFSQSSVPLPIYLLIPLTSFTF